MKKFFTLCAAFAAVMSVSAQEREIMAVASDEVQAKIANAIANPVELSNPNFFIVSQDVKVYPEGTYESGAAEVVASDGTPVTLKTYIWEYATANVSLKAVSTPNADASPEQAWEKRGNGKIGEDGVWAGNEAMNVAGCDPQFLYGTAPKNGNPSQSYKGFYDYNSDGNPTPRVYDGPYWAPGCGWLPAKGCYYLFTVKSNGKLKVALRQDKNLASRPLYIVDGETKEALATGSIDVLGFMQNNTFEKDADGNPCGTNKYKLTNDYLIVQDVEGAKPQNRPFFGYFTFDVQANKTYYILSSTSQPGIFGYEFIAGGSAGISDIVTDNASADNRIYNISGQQVNDSFRGIVIKNGKKYVK